MTLKSDTKFQEKMTLGPEKEMENFNTIRSSGKSENLRSNGLLLSKVCNV